MSRFNSAVKAKSPKTTNKAGADAYAQSEKLQLVSILLTSMLADQYYETAAETTTRLVGLINRVDPLFAAKAAVFARNEYGLRSISHVTAAEIVHQVKGFSWTKDFITSVVRRPDDMTEILAHYLRTYGKPVPNALKKGMAKAFNKFDAYQLAKYRAEGKDISLIDVVNLVHPKPITRNAEALRQLVAGTLRSTDTWESKLAQAGKSEDKQQAKAQAWDELIRSRKIGYFALLRNLRNIMTDNLHLADEIAALLTSETHIRKSLVMPFRYTMAYQEILNIQHMDARGRKILAGLDQAIDLSCANVPNLPDTLVVCDYSGSMGNSLVCPKGKGTLLGAVLAKRSNADFMIFGNSAAYLPYNPADTTMSLVRQFMKNNEFHYLTFGEKPYYEGVQVGHGTNFESIFDSLERPYKRIFIFSDMQGWDHRRTPNVALDRYKKRYNADPFIYSVDLAGHGTTMFPADKIVTLAGFSEKIFDLVRVMEQDKDALIHKIESVRFE